MKYYFLFLWLLLGTNSHAQDVHVAAEQDLNFGKFYISGNSMGIISINDDRTWQADSNVQFLDKFPQAAVFKIWTESLVPIKVRVEIINGSLSNSTNTLSHSVTNDVNTYYYIISHDKSVRINVGGSLRIEPNVGYSSGLFQGNVSVSATRIPFQTNF